jgi:hypothetical protein
LPTITNDLASSLLKCQLNMFRRSRAQIRPKHLLLATGPVKLRRMKCTDLATLWINMKLLS